jgi:2-isopropylmalate synthase
MPSRFETGVAKRRAEGAAEDQPDAGRHPEPRAPAVGALRRRQRLCPQGGPACQRDPEGPDDLRTHRSRDLVGNERVIPMSNQAGQSNLRARLEAAGIEVDPKDPRLGRIIEVVKAREDQGYAYDGAQASLNWSPGANWASARSSSRSSATGSRSSGGRTSTTG